MSKWSVASIGFLGGVIVSGIFVWLCGPVVVAIQESRSAVEVSAGGRGNPLDSIRGLQVVYQSNRYGNDGCWMNDKDLVVVSNGKGIK